MAKLDIVIGIGGAAGQGIATPGDILAFIFARRGLYLSAYNAYQSLIRGGHTFLTIRASETPVHTHGDKLDFLVPLNQDTMDRHLHFLKAGSSVIYDGDRIKPGQAAAGVNLCPLPVKELKGASSSPLVQNTIALGSVLNMLGVEFKVLEDILARQFKKKGDAVIQENVGVARAGYEYAAQHFQPLPVKLPMSPSTGVLMWYARHARQAGIMVRQVEDEIGVINMAIGAAHGGVRAMCATSGGGFALMTEGLGLAAMLETPVVCINVQRGGPATGIPTKTEQGDLWQALGAGQGDYPRVIVAPTTIPDLFNTVPELFNLTDKFQCPGIILSDLLLSEGRAAVPVEQLDFHPKIDRGELILPNGNGHDGNDNGNGSTGEYLRYKITESGISPRAVPGVPGCVHTAASDDHMENGVLISDEFTNPHKRQAMHEKRMRKMDGLLPLIAPPELQGPANAEVTLVGWGSGYGVIREACEKLAAEEGIVANYLVVKWLVPLHAKEITDVFSKSKRVVIVEQNYSGQFARYLRSETGLAAHAHIRKYDGEPFMPHHVVEGIKQILAGKTDRYVPTHELLV
jgi:2-oxoglutarate ferredoxin oxidoreductase subunit alpha